MTTRYELRPTANANGNYLDIFIQGAPTSAGCEARVPLRTGREHHCREFAEHIVNLLNASGQGLVDSGQQNPASLDDLAEAFEDALNVRPHLALEIGYTRITDWCVHVWDATNTGLAHAKPLIVTQSPLREEAVAEAVTDLIDAADPERWQQC